MNQLMLIVIVLVVFVYFGGANVPKSLRENKKLWHYLTKKLLNIG